MATRKLSPLDDDDSDSPGLQDDEPPHSDIQPPQSPPPTPPTRDMISGSLPQSPQSLEQPPTPPPRPPPPTPQTLDMISGSLPQPPQSLEPPTPPPRPPLPPPLPPSELELQLFSELYYVPLPGSLQILAQPPPPPRGNPDHAPRKGKPTLIPPPYPWATDHRAHVDSFKSLMGRGITTVSGDVQCRSCERQYQIEYNLEEKFWEIAHYVAKNRDALFDRAPPHWMNPILPSCEFCHQKNCVKPKMAEKKRCVNWLFLLLGQTLGCCTLEQLKYFCKHTENHRNGSKDRILFLAYLALCKQLYPEGPCFDR